VVERNARVDEEEEVLEGVLEEELEEEVHRIGHDDGDDDEVEVDLRRRQPRRAVPADLLPVAQQHAL
jgi:hypothetical protein